MIHLLNILAIVASASAQSFSFGTAIGTGSQDVIPLFESQRSAAQTSPGRGRPAPLSFSESFSQSQGFPSFFENFTPSRVQTPPPQRPQQTRSSVQQTSRQTSVTPAATSRNAPSPSRSTSRAPSTRSRDAPSTPSRVPSAPQTSRSNPLLASAGQDVSRVRSSSSRSRTRTPEGAPKSSRGRVKLNPVTPSVTRPHPTTTPLPSVSDNLVGQSICPRGTIGDACRSHLKTTAMACSSGFCKECQQCGTLSEDLWPKCCREHFLCCRPLAKACQSCDRPMLQPFCRAAFGRCN